MPPHVLLHADRRTDLQENRELLKRRLEMDQEGQSAAYRNETRRLDLEAQKIRLEERRRRDEEWEKAREYLEHSNERIKRRGEVLAA